MNWMQTMVSSGRHQAVLAAIDQYHQRFHPDQQYATSRTIPEELLDFRRRLHDEEVREVSVAWDAVELALEDVVYVDDVRDDRHGTMDVVFADLLHELADVVIVAYGTAMFLGVDLNEVMMAAMAAGMRKQPPTEPGGKAIKPESWEPADTAILEMVRAAR